jgi:hypothetical protein
LSSVTKNLVTEKLPASLKTTVEKNLKPQFELIKNEVHSQKCQNVHESVESTTCYSPVLRINDNQVMLHLPQPSKMLPHEHRKSLTVLWKSSLVTLLVCNCIHSVHAGPGDLSFRDSTESDVIVTTANWARIIMSCAIVMLTCIVVCLITGGKTSCLTNFDLWDVLEAHPD